MRTRTAAFHLGPFPKDVYLVVRSPESDPSPRFPRGFATPTSHARGVRLCFSTAPSSGRTLEIRATPRDSNLGETACNLLAKLVRKDGIAFHTVTKTEVVRMTNVGYPGLYAELQGPLGTVIGAARGLRGVMAKLLGPGAGVGVVSKVQGKKACTLHARKLTIRFYGNKTLARPLCGKRFRKGLAGG